MNNKVQLIGRLGQDPEVRHLSNGSKVANFSVATSDFYKNKQGERVEDTQWHNVVVWDDKLIENVVEKFMSKGSQVGLTGKLKTRSYETNSGEKKYVTEVVLERFSGEILLLGGREPSQRDTDIQNFEERKAPVSTEEDSDDLPF
ncbi:single-stranded DNA-binding protein [Roseivirga spongicola]|uniref:single-stranded DNA-binding protein n=1 Tax=Roseivirga spongicola TaxID=333140 RepID=UPI002AC8AA20|nr:single-stranded DNA-binding protein [Roseivirga spongicola]WPZ08803.1 single-stranded DNA-binding protein [Roseivirga spongicola]